MRRRSTAHRSSWARSSTGANHRQFPPHERVHSWKSGKLRGVLGVLVRFQSPFRIVRWKTRVKLRVPLRPSLIAANYPNMRAARRGAQLDAAFGLQRAQTAVDGALALLEASC